MLTEEALVVTCDTAAWQWLPRCHSSSTVTDVERSLMGQEVRLMRHLLTAFEMYSWSCDKLNSWELISWQVDHVRVDLVKEAGRWWLLGGGGGAGIGSSAPTSGGVISVIVWDWSLTMLLTLAATFLFLFYFYFTFIWRISTKKNTLQHAYIQHPFSATTTYIQDRCWYFQWNK